MTSRSVMFIQVSHETRRPLYVSPFLSSTSMGWPCAVLSRESGSYWVGGVVGVCVLCVRGDDDGWKCEGSVAACSDGSPRLTDKTLHADAFTHVPWWWLVDAPDRAARFLN